ncbi:MAG: hypothetical protein KF795_12420 [Labilithrix sp.]|nr:hypothetical protein [Labilithrix sp.]
MAVPTSNDPHAIPPAKISSPAGAVSPAEIDVELDRAMTEHYVEGRRGMRSLTSTALLVALAAGVALLPAWLPARRMLGVGLETTLPFAAISALSIVHAAIAFGRVGGRGRWYRVAEHVESVCSVSCGVALIYFSGSASSVFWLYFLLFVADSWNNPRDVRIQMTLFGVATSVLAVAFAVRGAFTDVAVVASVGVLGAVCIYAFAASARHRLRGEAERRALRARLEGLLVERERDRIARDLHDGVAADLSTLLWRARELKEAVAAAGNGEATSIVDDLVSDVRSSLDELRATVFALRVAGGTWDELCSELRTRVTRLCAGSLRCEIVFHDDEAAADVPVDVRIHVLRIVQEGVRNAVRHARAKVVRVELERGARVVVRISDDGEGMPDGALEASRGGLSNIVKRAHLLGGEASWSSDGGTHLVVTLPLGAPG